MQVPDYTIDKKQTVAGQMDGLLNQNNPYMKQAATAGQQFANKRGLLNSTMGAQASQAASIQAALPIAQADANTYNAFAGQKYGTQLQGAMNNQIQGFTQDNMRLGNTLDQSNMQLQQGFQQQNMRLGNTLDQGNMRLQQQLTEMQAQADNARQLGQMDKAAQLDRQMSELQQTFQRENMQTQNQFARENLAQSTTANTQGKYLDAIDNITNNAMVSINEIETAEGITQAEKDAMIANTIRRRDADLAWTRNLYSNMPTWDFSWVDTQSGRMPTAPGIG